MIDIIKHNLLILIQILFKSGRQLYLPNIKEAYIYDYSQVESPSGKSYNILKDITFNKNNKNYANFFHTKIYVNLNIMTKKPDLTNKASFRCSLAKKELGDIFEKIVYGERKLARTEKSRLENIKDKEISDYILSNPMISWLALDIFNLPREELLTLPAEIKSLNRILKNNRTLGYNGLNSQQRDLFDNLVNEYKSIPFFNRSTNNSTLFEDLLNEYREQERLNTNILSPSKSPINPSFNYPPTPLEPTPHLDSLSPDLPAQPAKLVRMNNPSNPKETSISEKPKTRKKKGTVVGRNTKKNITN